MRVLYASDRFYPPDQNGGAQATVHGLLRGSIGRGHACEAVVKNMSRGRHRLLSGMHVLSGGRMLSWPDRSNGYVTHRAPRRRLIPSLLRRLEAFAPDVILFDKVETLQDFLDTVPGHPVPKLIRIVDVTFIALGIRVEWDETVQAFSNSRFTAGKLRERLGIDTPTIYPVIDLPSYRVGRDGAEFITMINPTPPKGRETAIAVARLLPDRRFLFVGGPPSPEGRQRLMDEIGGLPNVVLHPWTNDPREIYERTRLLLMPSVCEEAFGRCVLEAQVSGIPVVARGHGGLPESVGEGGVLIAPEASPEIWAETLESVLSDASRYGALSEAAVRNAGRNEFSPERLTDAFLDLAERHVGRGRRKESHGSDDRSARATGLGAATRGYGHRRRFGMR